MHIAFTSDFLDIENIGGAGRVIWELARALDARGCDLSFVVGDPRGARVESIGAPRWDGATPLVWSTFPYRTSGRRGLAYTWATARRVRSAFESLPAPPDLVIHNQPLSGWALRALPIPSAYLFHSPWPLEYVADRYGSESWADVRGARARLAVDVRRRIERSAVRSTAAVMTLSQTMSDHVRAIHAIDADRVHVCPGGVDSARFSPVDAATRSSLRRRLGIGKAERLIVCVRRLVPRTGVDLLLEACASESLAPSHCAVRIAGRGPASAALEARIESLGLSDRVKLLGYVPDDELADLYRAADLAVVPTRALEGFGLATLEAMACGTPVVATPVGGTVEILQSFHPELLASAVDPEALATTIASALARGDLGDALRRSARAHVEAHYSWQEMADRLLDVANGVLGRTSKLTALV